MKHFRLILIPCLVLSAVGLVLIALLAPLDIHDSETVELAPGSVSVGHFVIDTAGGGSVEGAFATDSGRQVLVMILDEDQYEEYLSGQAHDAILSETVASGEFSLDRPAEELFHVVVEHAADPDSPERVTFDYTVHSMDWDVVILGIVLMFSASVVMFVAMMKHSRERAAVRGPISRYTDVVFFDDDPKR